uniref:Caspase domain-containing protein n=1 Tax=Candidatus Kentrum sp. FW TaxID=2126338 RepID=A0A450TFJ4_9GAMM|nr:MAG: Caspase domain-containing protein [Candidatus Kentron sp. FW]
MNILAGITKSREMTRAQGPRYGIAQNKPTRTAVIAVAIIAAMTCAIVGALIIILPEQHASIGSFTRHADTPGSHGERIALVVGNSDYENLTYLPNPANDAEAIARRLHDLGFTLFDEEGRETGKAVYDLDEDSLFDALDHFAERASHKEIALVYYAGHGMQIGAKSYLLPTDIPKGNVEKIRRNAFSEIVDPLIGWLDKNPWEFMLKEERIITTFPPFSSAWNA